MDDSVINEVRKQKSGDEVNKDVEIKTNVNAEANKTEEIKVYNKKIICLNVGMDGSRITLNFKEDFMDDMIESFTSIYNWMVINHFDALDLGDGILIYRNSIDEVVNVMKKLNSNLEK